MKRLGWVSLLALAWADPALAQTGPQLSTEPGAAARGGGLVLSRSAPTPPPATQIDPDLAPERSLNTNVTQVGNLYTIDGGTRAGNNLFHSFATFDLAAGDTARWVHTAGNPATLANVVNRVTGGTQSLLFGTLDSTAIPNAQFWFINPAGIVLGSSAVVNVPAAAHFSTASELRFASGPAFSVAAPDGSTLNVAAPQAFGFIGNEGAILVSGTGPGFLPGGGALALTGGDVRIEDSVFSAGELFLGAVGPVAAEIDVFGDLAGPLDGRLEIVNSSVTSVPGGGRGGRVMLAAGSFLAEASNVTSEATGLENAGPVRLFARDASLTLSFISSDAFGDSDTGLVLVEVDNLLSLDASFIASDAFGAGTGGGVGVVAGVVDLANGSFITSNAFGSGDSGLVRIGTGLLTLDGGSFIASDSLGDGNALGVNIAADAVTLTGTSRISSDARGDGESGIVQLEVAGAVSLADASVISSDSNGAGAAGGVLVFADSVDLAGTSRITSDARGDGDGGVVGVLALGRLGLSGGSFISADSYGAGSGLGVFVAAAEADLTQGSYISSDARGDGDSGLARVEVAGRLSLSDLSYISADALGAGNGGGVSVSADTLDLTLRSYISSDSLGAGSSGTVFVEVVGALALDFGSKIASDSFGFGDAGGVFLTAGSARLNRGSYISSDALGEGNAGLVSAFVGGTLVLDNFSYISSDVRGTGNGGEVSVTAGRIDLTRSFISSDTLPGSTGNAGDVSVETDDLNLADESRITSNAQGSGDAGRVRVVATDMDLTGSSRIASDSFETGFAGGVFLTVERGNIGGFSFISSSALGEGDAGGVFIDGGSLSLVGDSFIESDAFLIGNAGNVEITLRELSLTDSEITSEAGFTGDGGNIFIELADSLELTRSRIGTDTRGAGIAGNIAVTAGEIVLADASIISSEAQPGAAGASGFINLDAGSLEIRGGSLVSTSSSNPNPAGAILIDTGRLLLVGSEIVSRNESQSGGDAGQVIILAGTATLLAGRISTNSARGAAGDIVILMPDDSILRLLGRDNPSVIETSSGPGTGGRIIISSPFAIIGDGSRILALGQSGGANVLIDTQFFITSADRLNRVLVEGNLEFSNAIYDVSSGTVNPDLNVLDASGVLRGQCAAQRSSGEVSQLTVREFGPYASAPPGTPSPPPGGGSTPGDCL